MDRDPSILRKREHLDVLKKDGKLLRGAFLWNLAPGGQIESGLLVSQELEPLRKINGKKKKEIILVRSDDTERLNLRFPTESLTKDESLLNLFYLPVRAQNAKISSVIMDVIKRPTKIVIKY